MSTRRYSMRWRWTPTSYACAGYLYWTHRNGQQVFLTVPTSRNNIKALQHHHIDGEDTFPYLLHVIFLRTGASVSAADTARAMMNVHAGCVNDFYGMSCFPRTLYKGVCQHIRRAVLIRAKSCFLNNSQKSNTKILSSFYFSKLRILTA